MKTKAWIVIVFLCSFVINNLLINVNLASALATVRIDGRGYTEDDAIRNAIEKVIDEVVCEYYDSKTLVKDRTLLEHAMENYSKYVKYRIVDDFKKGKVYFVKLALEIDRDRLIRDTKSLMKSTTKGLELSSKVSVLSIVSVPRKDNKFSNKIIDEDSFGVPVSSMLEDALKERGLHLKNNYLSVIDALSEAGEDIMGTKKMLGLLKELYKKGKIGIERNGGVIYDPDKIAKYSIVVFFNIKKPQKINDVEYKLGATIDVTALSTLEDIIAKKTFDCYVFSSRPKEDLKEDFSRLTKKACESAGTLIASRFMEEIRDIEIREKKIEASTLILVVQNVDFPDCSKIKEAVKSGGKEIIEMKYNNRNCEIKVKTSDANAESVTFYELITKAIQKRTDNVSLEENKMTIIF